MTVVRAGQHPKPALELRSQLYALLGDRSSNPDGDSWPHWSLRRLVRDVLALPELRALIAERDEARATVERVRDEHGDAVRLLNELAEDTDATPCRYDHHGQCQEHSGGERCYDRDAHEFLKSVGVRALDEPTS